jgi:hypothetical protein
MLRSISCLYLIILASISWKKIDAQESIPTTESTESSLIKYNFVIDHNILKKDIVVEQPLIIPKYQITFKSIPTIKTCVSINCKKPKGKDRKKISTNQTWGGIFNARQRFQSNLTANELAYKLSENIKGLDPILATKIANLKILEKINLKKRPKNWEGFVKLISKIQKKLKDVDPTFNYNLYNEIINVHGYENGEHLDYYHENLCSKIVFDCPAENLDIRKKLISQTEKKLTINLTQPPIANSAKLFDHEKDSFEFLISENSKKPDVIAFTKHNAYQINWDEFSTEDEISVTITPLSRKRVPIPENFIHLSGDNYKSGIFFEWRLAQNQWNNLIALEKSNISIEYELCEIKFAICANKIRTKRFALNELKNLDNPTKNEVLLQRLTLDRKDLKPYGLYQMKYRLIVENSAYILNPKNSEVTLRVQYLPYL